MEKPHALDAPRFTDGHGTDVTLRCPFVELRARTAGIKFMPALRRSHPHRQIVVPVAGKFCGAGRCGTVAIFKCAQTGWRHLAGIPKIFLFTIHNLPSVSFEREFTPARQIDGVSPSPVVRASDTPARHGKCPFSVSNRIRKAINSAPVEIAARWHSHGLNLPVLDGARPTPRQNEVFESANQSRRNRNVAGQMTAPLSVVTGRPCPIQRRVQSATGPCPLPIRDRIHVRSRLLPVHVRARAHAANVRVLAVGRP